MKLIPLTQGYFTQVDDNDFDYLSQWKWFYQHGYARRKRPRCSIGSRTIHMHRVIMNTPSGMETDHQDLNRLNNQKSNLRNCTHSENQRNRRVSVFSRSGYKGVKWHKQDKKWVVRIWANGKRICIGYFRCLEDAALAYDRAAIELHGEFARTNF